LDWRADVNYDNHQHSSDENLRWGNFGAGWSLWSDLGGFELVKEKSFNTEGTGDTEGHREELRSEAERQEILQELLAGFGEDGFGMELHAFDFVAAVTEGMMMPSSVSAVIINSPRRDFLDDQGMIRRGGEGIRQAAENVLTVVWYLARFAMEEFGARTICRRTQANGWWPRHTPRIGIFRPALDSSTEMPASCGVQGPGEITMRSGFRRMISSTVILSLRCTSTWHPVRRDTAEVVSKGS